MYNLSHLFARICLKQGFSKEQVEADFKKFEKTTTIAQNFELSEEQLVQIAMEEEVSMSDGIYS